MPKALAIGHKFGGQDRLFIALSRMANDATDYFRIPTGRMVEVGAQVTIQKTDAARADSG